MHCLAQLSSKLHVFQSRMKRRAVWAFISHPHDNREILRKGQVRKPQTHARNCVNLGWIYTLALSTLVPWRYYDAEVYSYHCDKYFLKHGSKAWRCSHILLRRTYWMLTSASLAVLPVGVLNLISTTRERSNIHPTLIRWSALHLNSKHPVPVNVNISIHVRSLSKGLWMV